ncbi:unnamed protein product [Brassicogethes aeneus]|uniref:PLAT domain-containing protein n=1 Tax=Brassicogethes aeneus TaxID=1431903 RepID=A0A9P0FG66_BRAAE|nr:unnamed protein product [Brassicogethes aeneus]
MEIFDVALELQVEYIVFAVLVFLFILFLVVLWIISKGKKKHILDKNIIFLADIPRYCKFAYLMAVYTEKGFKKGTTSNITIKIYGDKSETKEHCINYPDPERHFLQSGNEDWFLIGSENYLGKLIKMELWFDSIGMQPTWTCSHIVVYDLQSTDYWLFIVKKKFSLTSLEEMIVTVKPQLEEPKRKTRKERFKMFWTAYTKDHFWLVKVEKIDAYTDIFRLTTIYSIILSILMISLVLYGLPTFQISDSIEVYGEYRLNEWLFLYGLISSVVTLCFHFPLVLVYGKCHANFKESKKTKNNNFGIGFCWFILITNIIFCNTALLVFGFYVPEITSFLWLTTAFFGIVLYAIIFEHITKFVYRKLFQPTLNALRVQEKFQIIFEFIEEQRLLLYNHFGQHGLRPYLEHLYKPLNDIELIKRKEFSYKRLLAIEALQDLIMFLIYIVILYLVILVHKDDLTVYTNKQVESMLKGDYKGEDTTENSHTLKKYIKFVNKTLLKAIQDPTWYEGYTSIRNGLMQDKKNSFLGVARFRQHRVVENGCKVYPAMRFLNLSCDAEYHIAPQTSDSGDSWKKKLNLFHRLRDIWKYSKDEESKSDATSGKLNSYPKGGYVAPLGRTLSNSLVNWEHIYRYKWIDHLTRLLIFEFLSYNVNTNLFTKVNIEAEFSSTGWALLHVKSVTSKLLFLPSDKTGFVQVVIVGFLTMLGIFVLRIFVRLVMNRKYLLSDFDLWLLVDVIIIFLSIAIVIMIKIRDNKVKSFLDELERTKNNEFITYEYLFQTDDIVTMLAAFLVCVSTIRLWKLLRFLVVFRIMERAMVHSISPIFSLFIYHLVFVTAFSLTGHMFFGDSAEDFKDMTSTMVALIMYSIGKKYKTSKKSIFLTWYHNVYYAIYMIGSVVVSSLYISIITICFNQAKTEFSNIDVYTLKHYVYEFATYVYNLLCIKIKNKRLRGGAEEEVQFIRSVYPKSDDCRYADCLTINKHRMKQMELAARCILRNIRDNEAPLSGKEIDLINNTIYTMYSKAPNDEKEIFFQDTSDNKRFKLVDDFKIQKMEIVCSKMLDSDEQWKLKYEKRQKELYEKIIMHHERQLNWLVEYLNKVFTYVDKIQL